MPKSSSPRIPPHNLEAEESLLGAALLSTQALEVLATRTRPEDFYKPAHGHIAAVLARAHEEGWPVDHTTVADELRRLGMLDDVGGSGILTTLIAGTPSTSNAGRYASIVHDYATMRRLAGAGAEIQELAYAAPEDVHEAVLRAQRHLEGVAANNGNRAYSSLRIVDLGPFLDGETPATTEPDYLARTDGKRLIYSGKMHVFQAEPSAGKSWLALTACVEVLRMGGGVVYLDFEDTAPGIVGRLRKLGADVCAVRDRFRYVSQESAFGPTEKVELAGVLRDLNPDLVVIDGVAEALSRDGYSEDRSTEVVEWIEKVPRWVARKSGAAVLMLDHVAKDRETRGRWARGSSAKLAAVDGAAYEVQVVTPFAADHEGVLRLVVAKDRHGGIGPVGYTAAVATITPERAKVTIRLEPPNAFKAHERAWRGIARMIYRELDRPERKGGLSETAVTRVLAGQHLPTAEVKAAFVELYSRGYLEERKGRSVRVLRPLDTPEDEEPPVEDEQGDLDLGENVVRLDAFRDPLEGWDPEE